MEKEKTEPKILIKKGSHYFEAKTLDEDLEIMLNGSDKFGKYQLPTVMYGIGVYDNFSIPEKKLKKYGLSIAVRKTLKAPEGVVSRKDLFDVIKEFFRDALSLAAVYRGDYVALDRMQIYEMTPGEVVVYEINGLAQLLRK